MNVLRLLFSREWVGYLVLLIAFAAGCVLLSQWQFARHDEAAARNQLVAQNWNATPTTLETVIADDDSFIEDDTFRTVQLQGDYLTDAEVLVRNRPRNGQPGFEQLIPFQTTDGRILAVSRGWLPTGSDGDAPDTIPAPTDGTLTIVVRMKAGEPSVNRTAPAGQLASIDLTAFAQEAGLPLITSAYGMLASESPAADATPLPAEPPSWDEGMHLSYALQWIAFILIAAIGLGYAIRTTLRRRREDAAAAAGTPLPPAPRRRDDDADYEDAVLDAHSSVR